jgi:DNA-directed RNA polymerase subunit RPC12/RpoP
MACSCWIASGVRREGQALYLCASCGNEVSKSFYALMNMDEVWADKLIEKGDNRRSLEKPLIAL